jgi:arabinofuranan 3-O-arabinosyltransferase
VRAGAAVQPRARRERSRAQQEPSPLARRVMWLGLFLGLVLLPLLSLPGRYVADTRDALWFSPLTYLARSLRLWQSSPYLGHEQRDGLLVPMGAVVAALRGIGLPVWIAERLWHGLLLFVSAAGVVALVDHLRGRKAVAGSVAAALVYTLNPYTLSYGLSTTGAFLPYVLMPTALLLGIRGLHSPNVRWPVLLALVVFLMGGGNGAPQVYALLPLVLYALWVLLVERSVPFAPVLRFGLLALLFIVGLNAYWLFAFTSSNLANILAFSEQPNVINVASSYSETVRGLGFWVYYGGDQFGAWAPTVQRFITSPPFVVASFAVPFGALVSAWRVRWRFRLFFVFLMILAVLVMAGAFPVTSPTPFGRLLLNAYARFKGLGGLRTTYKFAGALFLSMAVLIGVGLESGLERIRAERPILSARTALLVAAALVLLAGTVPLWSGDLYNRARSSAVLPGYWQQALSWLDTQGNGYRTFFAPSGTQPSFRWGTLHEGMAEADPELASVHPNRVPLGEHYGANLLAAIERPYQQALSSRNAAALFRYLGVKEVVLQNDLAWERAHTARPAELARLADDPSLVQVATFGRRGQNVVPAGSPVSGPAKVERDLPPVRILAVPQPLPVVRAEGGPSVVMSGDGFGLATLAGLGALQGNPSVLYSGSLTIGQLREAAREQAAFVITDSNRRRSWSFAGVRNNSSYTLPEDQTLGQPSSIAYGLFGGRASTQTVAVYQGIRSITASAYGSPFLQSPEYRPVKAFDGNPNTWWLVGILGNPVGQWVQERFEVPKRLSEVKVTLPPLGFGRRVSSIRLEFSNGRSVASNVHPGENVIRFQPRVTDFLRVRVVTVTDVPLTNGVGFSDIEIPGERVREVIRVPTDLFVASRADAVLRSALATAPLSYAFDRARNDLPLGRDEEQGIVRRFAVPSTRRFTLTGDVHLDPAIGDQAIDELLGSPPEVEATSSSRYLGGFNARASAALDGDPKTAWIPRGTAGQWLRFTFPERRLSHLEVQTQRVVGRTLISEMRVTFLDGSTVAGHVDSNGVMRLSFPARRTSSVTITVSDVVPQPAGASPPVGITEVVIPGVQIPPVPSERRFECLTTPGFTIDGIPVRLRMTGTVADLLSGASLNLSGCGNEPLLLSEGLHEMDAQGSLQPDDLVLAAGDEAPPSAPAPPTTVQELRDGGFDVHVSGAEQPFYLVIGQNFSPRWKASIDGASLGAPILLDGYSAGWRVSSKGSFTVHVDYGPQRQYELTLLVSALALLAALGILAAAGLRRGAR